MNTFSKSALSVVAAITVATATITPSTVFAWGDSDNGRPSYTIAEINEGKLGDKITFNSISDSKIGSEKNFVGAQLKGNEGVWNADTINVKDGEVYTIRLYVHNNSPKGKDAIAKDVKVNFSLPTAVSNSLDITGYIDSSNATPTRYWDEVTLKSDNEFYIEYNQGSAKYTNAKLGTVSLPNDVISKNGALIGYESLNGEIPGCYEYDGVVTIDVTVHSAAISKIAKSVRIKGSNEDFTESVNAKIGDEVEYKIEYTNLMQESAKNVMIRDILPTNMEYQNDSTYLYNSKYQQGVLLKDNTIATTGINIGNYSSKGYAYVIFTAKVVDKTLACNANKLVNWANVTVNEKVNKDDATIMVNKNDETCKQKSDDGEHEDKIVDTGADSVVVSAVGAGTVVTVLGYYISSRKKLM